MGNHNKVAHFSNRLFTRLYFVLVVTLIILGSGLEYILNQIDDSDSLVYTKKINKPIFNIISYALISQEQSNWPTTIKQYQNYIEQPVLLMSLSDFSADELTSEVLSKGDILALFDVEDKMTLYQRVGESDAVLGIETSLPKPKDQRAWVLPVFYVLLALVLYILIRPFGKQLLQLKQAAIALGLGDFSTRIEVPASTTLAPIADAFNAMTQKIKRLLSTQRDLVNAVSHELRTPLARLKFGFEEVALITDRQVLNQTVSAMKADVSELELLIDEMLRYAEVNQIKTFAKKPVNIHKMIKSLAKTHGNESVKVIVEISPDIKQAQQIQCHEMSINRALSNVLRNAISFANKQCLISVKTDSHQLLIDISDDGVGLEGVNIDRIFEPFFKVPSASRKPGYGLGLSIAQTIVKKHHGELSIVDGCLSGACFRFILPLL